MQLARRIRKGIKKGLFGGTSVPQRFFLGQITPQKEISVWLYGRTTPMDVTSRHSMACAAPFTICLALSEGDILTDAAAEHLKLKFCKRENRNEVLGEIGLRMVRRIVVKNSEFILFEARSSANFCMPKSRLWLHYLLYAYTSWRDGQFSDIRLSFLEKRAMAVMFICPRPVSLMSVGDETTGNMFPINIMGDLDNGFFSFALKTHKRPEQSVKAAGRLALSSVPFRQGSLAYQLGVNHNKTSIEWYKLPFSTRPSKTFSIPIPVFTLRARELQIEEAQTIGSHTLFIARVISDETLDRGVELCVIHGFYQAWRLQTSGGDWISALAEETSAKEAPPKVMTNA